MPPPAAFICIVRSCECRRIPQDARSVAPSRGRQCPARGDKLPHRPGYRGDRACRPLGHRGGRSVRGHAEPRQPVKRRPGRAERAHGNPDDLRCHDAGRRAPAGKFQAEGQEARDGRHDKPAAGCRISGLGAGGQLWAGRRAGPPAVLRAGGLRRPRTLARRPWCLAWRSRFSWSRVRFSRSRVRFPRASGPGTALSTRPSKPKPVGSTLNPRKGHDLGHVPICPGWRLITKVTGI